MEDKYDIIVFAHLYKPNIGGLERYVESFYKNMAPDRVLIVTSHFSSDSKSFEHDNNSDIIRFSCIKILEGKYYIPTFKGLKTIINVYKSYGKKVVIHTHTRFYLLAFIAVVLSMKYKLPHYHFEHGSTFVKDGNFIIRFFAYVFDQTFARYILKNAKQVFPISEGVRAFLNEHYPRTTLGPTLYNAYDFKQPEFKQRDKPNRLKILFVGRIVRGKGVYELVDALKIVKSRKIPFSVKFIGEGTELTKLKQYSSSIGLEGDILFTGRLEYEKTQLEYKNSDIFVNPSYSEGLPTTVLEAIGNNLCVVATDVGGTSEIIPTELLVPANQINGENIANSIISTFENWDVMQKEFQQIFKSASMKFNWVSTVGSYKKAIT